MTILECCRYWCF